MKKVTVSIFLLATFLKVCDGGVFDEKQDAIKAIDDRFKDVQKLKDSIIKGAEAEKPNVNSPGEKDLLNYLTNKKNDSVVRLEEDAKAVIRTAIVKAKPVTVIYCIRNVTTSGSERIQTLVEENRSKVLRVKTGKLEKINFDVYAVTAIVSGLKELVDQAKTKITEGSGVIQNIKREALNNCESANLLLGEIEVCLHEPIMSKEYIKMRQEIDRSFKAIQTKLLEDLQKCVT